MEDKIIAILRLRGPTLPSGLAKQLKTDTFFAGAHLSSLLEKNMVRVSSLKIGSSPLYYLKEQKYRLEGFAKHLGEKEKKAFDLIKAKKILKDKDQSPVIRVALRSIRDFAVQLNVRINGEQELFWKFYSVKDEEINSLIRQILEKKIIKSEQKLEKKIIEKPKTKKQETLKKPEPNIKEHPKEKQETIKKPKIEKAIQQKIVEKQQPKIQEEFYQSIIINLNKRNITVETVETIKKKNEYDLIMRIPSPAGELTYYCKAKNKKRVSEGDLSSTIMKAQNKRLPALFLTTGNLTKKAEKALKEELNNQIKIMHM